MAFDEFNVPCVQSRCAYGIRFADQTFKAMGLLKLLTFPVSGPIAGGIWLLKTLQDEAERQYYDPDAIRQEIAELQRQHQAGLIDEETLDVEEDALLKRLLDARDYRLRKGLDFPARELP